jgi:putative oxidoreductase
MNWFGNQKGEGYEFHLLMIGLSIATLINGSGKYSLDAMISSISRQGINATSKKIEV